MRIHTAIESMKSSMWNISDNNPSHITSWGAFLTKCVVFFCFAPSLSYSRAVFFPFFSFPALKILTFVLGPNLTLIFFNWCSFLSKPEENEFYFLECLGIYLLTSLTTALRFSLAFRADMWNWAWTSLNTRSLAMWEIVWFPQRAHLQKIVYRIYE